MWSTPSYSTNLAPGIIAAVWRARSMGMHGSPLACRTSVGTVTDGRRSRTSMVSDNARTHAAPTGSRSVVRSALPGPVAGVGPPTWPHERQRSALGRTPAREQPFGPPTVLHALVRRVVLRLGDAGGGRVQEETGGSCRVGDTEQHGHRPAFGDPVEHSTLDAGGVHHRAGVVDVLIDAGHWDRAVRAAGTACRSGRSGRSCRPARTSFGALSAPTAVPCSGPWGG